MRRTLSLLALLLLLGSMIHAATVSGFVTQEESGEPLQYVNVRIIETKTGMQTNKKGYYVLTINEPGTYTLQATLISYQTWIQRITIKDSNENINLDIPLVRSGVELSKVVVTGKGADGNFDDTPQIKVSLIRQTTEDIQNVVSVAEADVFRSILTLPGVTPISDFSAGLYVRGGSPDQNLILLDDIDVYNPSHFGGVFSTFNSDAVGSV
ncbi:MAG: TonB-dependent receptor, partial [Candidatus Cloacimonadaceae bacterium]|nr:TonB-dependent receptor [Candidatus Cloacimonadaceae bacterium]